LGAVQWQRRKNDQRYKHYIDKLRRAFLHLNHTGGELSDTYFQTLRQSSLDSSALRAPKDYRFTRNCDVQSAWRHDLNRWTISSTQDSGLVPNVFR
jgi:hypothetical protein